METYLASKCSTENEDFGVESGGGSANDGKINKVHHHIPTRAICPICGREEEGSHHALVACMHACG